MIFHILNGKGNFSHDWEIFKLNIYSQQMCIRGVSRFSRYGYENYTPLQNEGLSDDSMSFYRIQKYGSAARKLLAVNAQNRNDSEYNGDNDESSAA